MPAALHRLDVRPDVAITPAEATKLTGVAIVPSPGFSLYLVRAVALNEDTGRFDVREAQGEAWVDHGSLGRGIWEPRRRALVAELAQRPTHLFVTCSMAE